MSIKNLLNSLLKARYREDEEELEEIKIETQTSLGQRITFNLLAIALIVAFVVALQSILVPILFAIIFTVVIFPLCNKLETWGVSRIISSIIGITIAILVSIGMGYIFVKQTINIGQDASEIVNKIQTVLERGEVWINENFDVSRSEIINKGKEQLGKIAPDIGNFATSFFGSLGNFISMGVLIPLMVFFFLYYRDFFKEFMLRAFSGTPSDKLERTMTKMYEALKNYLGGMIMVMGIIAILNTVGLWILGIQYAWFFGILASLLMLLPYIGIAIGSILPALFALATKDSVWYAVGVVGWFQLVQILEGNIITPNIVGSKISLNPLVSILSIFFFSMMFGFAGLILALPLMAVLKVIFDAVPQLKPYGFLFSEPTSKFLMSESARRKKIEKNLKERKEFLVDSQDTDNNPSTEA